MHGSFILPLYLKYRVVLTGERCKGKITGIVEQKCGYTVGGVAVKKHAYQIKIGQKQYYTAHGCLILPLGRKKIGKEIWVFKNENMVGKCSNAAIFDWNFFPAFLSSWEPISNEVQSAVNPE